MQLFKDPTNYDNLNKTSLKEKVNIVMYSGLYLSGFKNSSILEDFEKITDVLVNLHKEIETSKQKGNYFAPKGVYEARKLHWWRVKDAYEARDM